MDSIVYILKICYHLMFAALLFTIAARKNSRKMIFQGPHIIFTQDEKRRIPFSAILIFCLMEGLYSFLCGPYKTYLVDRQVYAQFFSMNYFIRENSPVLYQIEVHLRQLTSNPDVFFFVVAVIYMLITCIAYNESDDADPFVFLLIGVSQYLLYGCYQLKQALAVVFIALSTSFFLKKRWIWCVLFLILGILSHESAYVAIPLFIVLIGSRRRWVQTMEYFILIVSMVFFRQITTVGLTFVSGLIPGISKQIASYLSDSGELVMGFGFSRALKGLPFYIITIYGFMLQDKGRQETPHYDKYLLISVFVSIASFSALYMPWMFRFGELFYIPDFIFAAYLRKIAEKRTGRQYTYILVLSFLIFTLYKLVISYWRYGGIV